MLILASVSPRRRELLGLICPEFSVIDAAVDETLTKKMTPHAAVACLSRRKARAVAQSPAGAGNTVIGADTVVAVNGEILGKPRDRADAERMLRLLSGKTHFVYTGVTVIGDGREDTFVCRTAVTFYTLSDAEISAYVTDGEPMDKAGAYAVQGKGCVFVKGICGDYFNVVGLPVAELQRHLRDGAFPIL